MIVKNLDLGLTSPVYGTPGVIECNHTEEKDDCNDHGRNEHEHFKFNGISEEADCSAAAGVSSIKLPLRRYARAAGSMERLLRKDFPATSRGTSASAVEKNSLMTHCSLHTGRISHPINGLL